MNTVLEPNQILKAKLSERMSANPQYSLRAFARDLGILPQTLSHILNGTKGLSATSALLLSKKLNFSKQETEFFCTLVDYKFARSSAARKIAEAKLQALELERNRTSNLTLDSFRVISDWYHFAIVELIKLQGAHCKNANWISKKLGIQEIEIKMALGRLERLELISKTKTGYQVNQDSVFTTDGVPSDSLKKFHKQVLEKAMAAITLQSVDSRNIMASFMPIATTDLPRAKKMMNDFRDQFVKTFSKEGNDRVYALSMQFFDLTTQNNS